uniref:Glycosyltransferase n=1 Tax=viral metagenome TaxID=1070528 RepID=A0A6C0DQ73_9ZZZZ
MNNIPTVVFCIPGGSFSNHFLLCWTELIRQISKENKYNYFISNNYSSHVHFVRAMCLGANVLAGPDQKPFQGNIKYDAIVWLDSDMVFNNEMIFELIDACLYKYPVVSGVYAMQGGNHFACIKRWDEKIYIEKGHFEFLSIEESIKLLKHGEKWIKCAYTGMGCMAIRYGVIEDERIKYPWFFCDIKKFSTNNPAIPYITDGTSEDVSFIRNLIDNGIIDGVMVNLSLRFGHVKTTII